VRDNFCGHSLAHFVEQCLLFSFKGYGLSRESLYSDALAMLFYVMSGSRDMLYVQELSSKPLDLTRDCHFSGISFG